MFDSVDEMVAENDHQQLDEDLKPEDKEPTPEYTFLSPVKASYIGLCKAAKIACIEVMSFLFSTSQISRGD
jgi:hypothetical protein